MPNYPDEKRKLTLAESASDLDGIHVIAYEGTRTSIPFRAPLSPTDFKTPTLKPSALIAEIPRPLCIS